MICSHLRAVRPHGSQTSGQVRSQIHLCWDSLALTQSVFTNINSFPSNSTNPSRLSSNLCYLCQGGCLASLHHSCCGKPITENKEMTSVFNFLNSLKLSGGGPETSQAKYLKYENKNNVLFLKVFWKWFLSINHTGMLLSRMVHLVNDL